MRQQQESAGKLAEAQANLTKAMTQKEVVAARSQMHRAQAALTAAQSKLALSSTSYQTRL
ncbi:MAG: hypothetical protein LH474_00625 [Chamaesiphon sp.]|nr:hypothetical protein [Chamaesiphon sp.]